MIITVAAAAAIGTSAASGMPYQEQGPSAVSVTAVSAATTTAAPDAFERAAARGSAVSAAGRDEATLASRGIDVQPLAGVHDEATLVARGIETPAPVGDSGSGLELPSLDAPTAAAVAAGLAGAGLLIAAAMFAAGRNRIRPL
jgi:hypothetical protein